MPDSWTWEAMTKAFIGLGGAVDNVRRGLGPHGYGLFPIDPAQPVRVHVPRNLLIATDSVVFENGALLASPAASLGAREREFFARYQDAFSWRGGDNDCTQFVAAMDALPGDIRVSLVKEFQLGALFSGSATARAQSRFLASRPLSIDGGLTFMPVVELCNHATGETRFQAGDGVTISGTFPGEVLIRYHSTDPFGIFRDWGFASAEPAAFSLPLMQQRGGRVFGVLRALSRKTTRDGVRAPTVAVNGKLVNLSHLMLGYERAPDLPRRMFRGLMDEIGEPDADGLFDAIRAVNRGKFETLAAALVPHQGPGITLLGAMCRYQLAALACCDDANGA